MPRSGIGLLLAIAVVLAAGLVLAESGQDQEAKEQFLNGVDLFGEGKYEQAAVAFARAYELKPHFKILFNIGQAENELGHYAAALQAYVRYLDEGGSEVPAERAEQVKVEIKRLNTLVGMVQVKGGPAGAKVLVDKEERGSLPLEKGLFLDLGKHEIAIEADGKRVFERVITVAGGGQTAVEVRSEGPAEVDRAAETGQAAEAKPADEKARGPLWVWGWVATGAGAVILVAGAATGGAALSLGGDLESSCPDGICPPDKRDDLDTMNALGTSSTVLLAAGGVVAATGIVLLVVDALGKDTDQSVALAPNGAAWTWRF